MCIRDRHGAGNKFVGVSARKKSLRTGIGSRELKGGIAFKAEKIRKAIEQIAHDLQTAAIGRIRAIGLSVAVVGAVTLVGYG